MAFLSRFFFSGRVKAEDLEANVKLETSTPIKLKLEIPDNVLTMPGSFSLPSEPSGSAYPSPAPTPERKRRVVTDADGYSPPVTPSKTRDSSRARTLLSQASSSTNFRENPSSGQPATRRSTRIQPQPPEPLVKVKPERREPALLTPPITPVRAPKQTRTSSRVITDPPRDEENIFNIKSDEVRPRQTRSKTLAPNSLPIIKLEDLEFDTPEVVQVGPSSEPPALILNGPSGIFRNGETLQYFQALDLHLLLRRERGERVCETDVVNDVGHVLAYDMGCGKTVMSIALIVLNPPPADFEGVKTTLVIVPSQGIIDHWLNEVKIFAPHLKACHYASVKERLRRDVDIVLCTYAQIQRQFSARKVKNNKSPLYDLLWYRIVTDEAHTFRNPQSQTAQGIWALRKKHGLCLTGTPAQNSLKDYYPLFKFLDVKYQGIDDLEVYNSKIIPKRKGYPSPPGAERLLCTLKRSFFIVREKFDPRTGIKLVNLPQRTDHIIDVHLTSYERTVYDHVGSLLKQKTLAKFIRLRQACDHPVLVGEVVSREILCDDDPEKDRIFSSRGIFNSAIPSSKIRAMLDILRKRPSGEKTIIFTHFTALFKAVCRTLEDHGIKWVKYSGDMDSKQREQSLKIIKEDDGCTVILVSILAGGVGLHIISCSSVILLDPWWNPYIEEQAISRVHRIGQVKPVNVYHLVSVNTVEVYIMETQAMKRQMIEGSYDDCFEDECLDGLDEGAFEEWLKRPNHDSDDAAWRDMYEPMDVDE